LASSVAMAVQQQMQPLLLRFTYVLESAESEKQQLRNELAQYKALFCIIASNCSNKRPADEPFSDLSYQQDASMVPYSVLRQLELPIQLPQLSAFNRHSSMRSAIGIKGGE